MITYTLNIGDLVVTKGSRVHYSCLGIGSCICLFLQDRMAGISGGAHIMLPESVDLTGENGKYYYATAAVNELVRRFSRLGSNLTNLRAKITGGANVIDTSHDIGDQNAQTVIKQLVRNNVYIAAKEVGGKLGRSARFDSDTGVMTVTVAINNSHMVF